MRGYFGIAVWKPKTTVNIGTLWRSAHVFGASWLAVIAGRYHQQPSDTLKSTRHVPLYTYDTFADFYAHLPHACRVVAVECLATACDVTRFSHPSQAVYVLGPEDGSLGAHVLRRSHARIVIPGPYCLNLAVAGSIVMYDRVAKRRQHLALTDDHIPLHVTA